MGSLALNEGTAQTLDVQGSQIDFEPVKIPNQRNVNGNVFPLLLKVSKQGAPVTLDEEAAALAELSRRGLITKLLNAHGALIIRGQTDPTPKAMSVLVHAVEEARNHEPFDQLGLAGSRTNHDKEVFSASEAPPNVWIHQHNEYSRYTQFPSNIHFFCSKSAPKGGESPLAHSSELYDRVKAELPEFIEELSSKGLMSPDVYRPPGKEGKDFIFTWAGQYAFGRDIKPNDDMETMKRKAEIQARRLTPHFWWKDGDELEVHQYVPAIRRHPATGKPVFFNSLVGRYGTAYDQGATNPPYKSKDGMAFPPATYADGTPIPKEYLHRSWEISKEILVPVATLPGDLALVDNYQVSHGRVPWSEGDRKVLVSMWDTKNAEERIWDY